MPLVKFNPNTFILGQISGAGSQTLRHGVCVGVCVGWGGGGDPDPDPDPDP